MKRLLVLAGLSLYLLGCNGLLATAKNDGVNSSAQCDSAKNNC